MPIASKTRTDYIVYSDDPEYSKVEHISKSAWSAAGALLRFKREKVPALHMHEVTGITAHPLNEETPVSEICINGACYK